MSIDKSLVIKSRLKRHRNVLTRTERVESLAEEERWKEGDPVFGLPKVRHIKQHEIVDYPGNSGRSINNLRFGWNARNDNGEPVVSGLYIAVVRHEEGDPERLKVAIIRP